MILETLLFQRSQVSDALPTDLIGRYKDYIICYLKFMK